jgi:hypothetical protein
MAPIKITSLKNFFQPLVRVTVAYLTMKSAQENSESFRSVYKICVQDYLDFQTQVPSVTPKIAYGVKFGSVLALR